jgi:hypothetical protein
VLIILSLLVVAAVEEALLVVEVPVDLEQVQV